TAERLLPTHLTPGIGDLLAHHRRQDAILVHGIAVGEAALDAAMAMIGLAGLVGHHANDLVALDLRFEIAADAAIGAGGHHGALRHALFENRLLAQRIRRAGLHASPAGHAFGFQERLVHRGDHPAFEAAAL